MVVDAEQEGFGFTEINELINGKAVVTGFLLLLDFELLTGKGLKRTGFLFLIIHFRCNVFCHTQLGRDSQIVIGCTN